MNGGRDRRGMRKPLILFTPKSLLRHPKAVSTAEELTSGGFNEVIGEVNPLAPDRVSRVIFCSGKVYYDLLAAREERGEENAPIIRLEQMYPFPTDQIQDVLARYPVTAEVVWVQEEPKNMGPWRHVAEWMRDILAPTRRDHSLHRPRRKRQPFGRLPQAPPAGTGGNSRGSLRPRSHHPPACPLSPQAPRPSLVLVVPALAAPVRTRHYYLSLALSTPRRPVRLPQHLIHPQPHTPPPAPHKQRIAQPVQIPHRLGRNRLGPRQRHQQPLRPPAHRPANMQLGIQPAPARQHERPQRRQPVVHPGQCPRSSCATSASVIRACLGWDILGQRRQNRPQVEQLMLHPQQDPRQFRRLRMLGRTHRRQPHKRVQLVHRAVALNARSILSQILPARQARLARIPPPCIDPVQSQPRRLEGWFQVVFLSSDYRCSPAHGPETFPTTQSPISGGCTHDLTGTNHARPQYGRLPALDRHGRGHRDCCVTGFGKDRGPGWSMAALGGGLVLAAATGYSPLLHLLGINSNPGARGRSTTVPRGLGIRLSREVTVDCLTHDLWEFWRDFENLPHIMPELPQRPTAGGQPLALDHAEHRRQDLRMGCRNHQ